MKIISLFFLTQIIFSVSTYAVLSDDESSNYKDIFSKIDDDDIEQRLSEFLEEMNQSDIIDSNNTIFDDLEKSDLLRYNNNNDYNSNEIQTINFTEDLSSFSGHNTEHSVDFTEEAFYDTPYTIEELNFFNLAGNNSNHINIQQNTETLNQIICKTFQKCLDCSFSSYLSVKQQLLYVENFLTNFWQDFKKKLLDCGDFSEEKQNISLHDYALERLYINLILKAQAQKDELNTYFNNMTYYENNILSTINNLDRWAIPILSLIGKCPSFEFQETNNLQTPFPSFYTAFQKLNQKKSSKKPCDNLLEIANSHNQASISMHDAVLTYIKNILEGYTLDQINAFTNEDWEDKAKKLKNHWNPNNSKTFSGLLNILYTVRKNEHLPSDQKNNIAQLSSAAQRLCNQERTISSLTPAQKTMLTYVKNTLEESTLDQINAFTNEDWEDKAKKLKNVWDPNNSKTFGSLAKALNTLYKNEYPQSNQKHLIAQLSKAAQRLYNQERTISSLTPAQKTMLTYVKNTLEESTLDQINAFTNEDWENKAKKLKNVWDPNNSKTFGSLAKALNTLYKNEYPQSNQKHLIAQLSNASERLYNQERTISSLTPAQETMLTYVKKTLEESTLDQINAFTNEDWEDKAKKLKNVWDPNNSKTFSGLKDVLYRLVKNEHLPSDQKHIITQLALVAQKLYLKEKTPSKKPHTNALETVSRYNQFRISEHNTTNNNIKKRKTPTDGSDLESSHEKKKRK